MRPYPNADRALRQIQRTRAVYQYGRCPQRYVMGIDPPPADWQRSYLATLDRCTSIWEAIREARAPHANR